MIENSPKGTQILFMKLLIHLAEMDGEISKEEEKIVSKFSKTLNIPWKDLNHNWELPKILKGITDSDGKIYFIVELTRLAFSDGTYDNLEKDTILKIAEKIDISEEKSLEIENWVKKEFALKEEFNKLLKNNIYGTSNN